jgi:Ca2+-binding EF-hand superfamily protein
MVMGSNGHLTIDDFVVASMNQYRNLSDAVIKNMFSHLDSDDDGWITPEDAFGALQPSGIHITVKELRKLFDKYGVKRRMGETQEGKGAR